MTQRLEISSQKSEVRVVGGTCAECGFQYLVYRGHLEPCPRCAVIAAAKAMLALGFGVDREVVRRAGELLMDTYPVRR